MVGPRRRSARSNNKEIGAIRNGLRPRNGGVQIASLPQKPGFERLELSVECRDESHHRTKGAHCLQLRVLLEPTVLHALTWKAQTFTRTSTEVT